MSNRFSENLKKIRKENNLSQEQLADELGVSRQAISKWESAVSYPEMDKIIALCDKFDLNIDDLLHKDIREVKGEEESRKRISNSIDDFLRYITNTINLFSNMSFKSKIKCLFEQFIIMLVLFFMSMIIYSVLENLFGHFVAFLPNRAYEFITNILNSILIVFLLLGSFIIITHIFKVRYLDYYDKLLKNLDNQSTNNSVDSKDDEYNKNSKVVFQKNNNKIIIRDPKHSEYKFINNLYKIVIFVIKLFALWFGLFVVFVLISLLLSFVLSFLLYKTGFLFVGLLLSTLTSSIIAIIILLLIINFVFNRKNDKKKMIWTFICSLVLFGIGCGFVFLGLLSFDVIENDESNLKTVIYEYNMKDDLLISFNNSKVEYITSDNSNIKLEYSISKYCEMDVHYNEETDNTIMPFAYCQNPTKLIRAFLNNINDKKIIPINSRIERVRVYTNQSNIDILKNNYSNYLKEIEKENTIRNDYENRINELEKQNNELQQEVYELQEQLSNQRSS